MTAMLMPAVNSYFAIYTLEGVGGVESEGRANRGMNWDLHATATDRALAISHARMLALQPGVAEVHVKHVSENLASGTVSVRDVKRCKRGGFETRTLVFAASTAVVTALAVLGVLL